jgi:hypothetical protein
LALALETAEQVAVSLCVQETSAGTVAVAAYAWQLVVARPAEMLKSPVATARQVLATFASIVAKLVGLSP